MSKVDVTTIKVLSITAKCSDLFFGTFEDKDGNQVGPDVDGYVPRNLGIGGGDYVEMKIDLETGQILNWKKPSQTAIKNALAGKD